jgi:hypothetical protein
MPTLTLDRLKAYRAGTFRTEARLRLTAVEQAVDFVNQRGFLAFWPIKGVILPSLWGAVAGDRPVPDEHDDPGHVSWGWKDSMLGKKVWYYARVIRHRNTFISLELAPYFYALTENYGSPEEDYLDLYQRGRLTLEAKLVYEALLKEGPLDTIALRKAARLTSAESNTRFNRAMDELMVDFKILPVGVVDAGTWHYAYMHDLVPRHFPELPEKARFIQETEARAELITFYIRSAGAVQRKDIARIFGWGPEQIIPALQKLQGQKAILSNIELSGQSGEWIGLPSLVDQP